MPTAERQPLSKSYPLEMVRGSVVDLLKSRNAKQAAGNLRIVDLGAEGLSLVAGVPLQSSALVGTFALDITLLFSEYGRMTCARCFCDVGDVTSFSCDTCFRFSVCERCNTAEVWDSHHLPCQLFCRFPEDLQSQSADCVRFLLDYLCGVRSGNVHLTQVMQLLEQRSEWQSPVIRNWCEEYARRVKCALEAPGIVVNESHLAQVLLKGHSNAIRLPINSDEPPIGWALSAEVGVMRHSCSPNCEITLSANGRFIELHTLRPVLVGEELTLTYEQAPTLPGTKEGKMMNLLPRPKCVCENCKSKTS